MKSTDFVVDETIPSEWYIGRLFEYLKKLGLRGDIRPENMKIEDFAKLTNLFLDNIQERKE